MVVSGGSSSSGGLNKDTRRCFLRCLQVSNSSSLLFNIEFWSAAKRPAIFHLKGKHFQVVPSFFGCFSFGPEHIQSPDIWSPTIGPQEQTVPAHLVPETIGPPGQLVPKHLVPMDKWSPGQLVPLDKWSPNIWSPWTNGPQKNWSPWTIGPQNLLVV